MAFDHEADDERPDPEGPLPPDDRIWRHPSEIGGGTPPPAAWVTPAPRPAPRRGVSFVTVAAACMTGATVAVGVMWLTRPTKVVFREATTSKARSVTTAVYSPAGLPSQALAAGLAPSLVTVSAGIEQDWTTGTGIWLDDHGTVAVASPLVEGADSIMVTTLNGTPAAAERIGTDPITGMTVLTVPGEAGTPITASQPPASATAGEPVAVVGAASAAAGGATQQRVLRASIGGVGVRDTVDDLVIHDALQLDRAIPADALGSVVVDVRGRMVGVVLSGSGDDRLAVIVPAQAALAAAQDLRSDGKVQRAWLGVRSIDLGPDAALMYQVPGGALLTEVIANSPAASAGLQPGDVIIAVNGQNVAGASDLVVALHAWKPGEQVELTWRRGAKRTDADVTLGG